MLLQDECEKMCNPKPDIPVCEKPKVFIKKLYLLYLLKINITDTPPHLQGPGYLKLVLGASLAPIV